MVNQQAFVQTIHNLTGNDTSTELAQFCRRWLEDNSDKLSIAEADRFLNSLTPANNPSMFTLGSVCILICKMQKIKSDQSCLEFVAQLQNQIPCFDVRQLQWAPDIFNRLFENIADFMLRRNLSLWAIPLLETAILTFCRGNPSQLTNLHCTLFCLCLKARHFDRAMPFLKINVTELFKQSDAMALISAGKKKDGDKSNGVSSSENSHPQPQQQQQSSSSASSITSSVGSFLQKAVNTVSGSLGTKSDEPKPSLPLFKKRSVLLYFYYGALIFGALEQWEEAALFLEHAICLPTKKTSFIVLESLKKFILISLIIGRKKPLDFLPTYRTPPVQRTLLTLASTYMKLPALIDRTLGQKNDVATALTVYWGENRAIFARDQNAGLMKVLINVCRENALKRLSNIFVSLQLGDVCRMAHLPVHSGENIGAEEESVEQIILRLRRNHQLTAHIDGRTQTVVFEEKDTLMGQDGTVGPTEMDIDTAMEEVIGLARTIRSFDDAIRLNPHFIEKTLQKVKDRRLPGGGGNGGGGAHGSGSIFPEDEGFFLTGSP